MSISSNLARLWTVANFFFVVVTPCSSRLSAQQYSSSTAGSIQCSTSLTSATVFSFAATPVALHRLLRGQNPSSRPEDENDQTQNESDSSGTGKYVSRYLGVCSAPSPFGIKDLSQHEFDICSRLSSHWACAMHLRTMGLAPTSSLYSELHATAAVAFQSDSSTCIAASLHGVRSTIVGYAPTLCFSADLGLLLVLDSRLSLAARVRNLTRNGNSIDVDQSMHVGFAYRLSSGLQAEIDLSILLHRSSGLALALLYKPLTFLALRVAGDSASGCIEFSSTLGLSSALNVHMSSLMHPDLESVLMGGVSWTW